MNLVLCGKCAWLGEESELAKMKPDDESLTVIVKAIVKKNQMSLSTCPSCGSTVLFRKQLIAPISIPTVFTEPYQNPEPNSITIHSSKPAQPMQLSDILSNDESESEDDSELDVDIVDDLLASAAGDNTKPEPEFESKVAKELPKSKKRGRKKKSVDADGPVKQPGDEDYVAPNRERTCRVGCDCDTCGKKFISKVGRETRCPDCLRATMKKLIG